MSFRVNLFRRRRRRHQHVAPPTVCRDCDGTARRRGLCDACADKVQVSLLKIARARQWNETLDAIREVL